MKHVMKKMNRMGEAALDRKVLPNGMCWAWVGMRKPGAEHSRASVKALRQESRSWTLRVQGTERP